MATLIIMTKAVCLPDSEDTNEWKMENDNNINYYHRKIGEHEVFVTECITEVRKRQRTKHNIVARFVSMVREKTDRRSAFYLIVHDKDMLRPETGDEGIYSENYVMQIGSKLCSLIPDRHIYLYQHIPKQAMFEVLIKNLISLTENNVNAAISIIENCTHETRIA